MKTILYLIRVAGVLIAATGFGADAASPRLSPEEHAWIDRHPTVRVFAGHAPPFMFVDGEVRGIAIDYLTRVFDRNGIDYRYVKDPEVSWPQALESIGRHEVVDLLPTAKITDDRKKRMRFTNEYIFAPWVIFTRSDADFVSGLADLKGKTVSVEEGFVLHDKLKREYPDIRLKVVPATLKNYTEIPLRDLSTGVVDAYIGNLFMTTYLMQSKGYTNIKVAAPTPFGDHNQAMAVRSDWPELVGIINKTIAAMGPDEHAAIRNKWLTVRYEYGIEPADVLRWILGVMGVSALVVGFVLFWNKRLQREVAVRKQIEGALRENEERYKKAQRMGRVGNWEYDVSTGRFWGSDEARRIYGFGPESKDFTTEEVESRIPERERVHQALVDLVEREVPYHLEFEIRPRSGPDKKMIRSIAEVIRDDSGAPVKVVGLIQDVTREKAAEKAMIDLERRLRQSQKMEAIGTLAGGIAHDFNNILSSVIGYTELALDDVEKGTRRGGNLQEVYIAGTRARDLVRQILAFARRTDEERSPIAVDAVAAEVLKLIRSTIPTTIEIRRHIESRSLIMGNPTQIYQVFMNLLTNAAQAMADDGGVLEVGVTDVAVDAGPPGSQPDLKPGGYVRITVSDTGPGIPPEILHAVFEPYFTTKAVGKGSGMGLAVAHGIVESHGGRITVESMPGSGALFTVWLPTS